MSDLGLQCELKIFIKRIIKADPEILKYVAPEVRADPYFMEEAIYINRDALKYASWALLDNKLFMKKNQCYRIKNKGLSKINENDIYDVSTKSDIIVNIELI